MAKRTDKSGPPYTEAQTKAWLSWLARGMQQHGQTVFMIEQLQPSWLSTRAQRWVYLLISRLFVWSVLGLLFAFCAGLYFGLSVGSGFTGTAAGLATLVAMLSPGLYIAITDGLRFERRERSPFFQSTLSMHTTMSGLSMGGVAMVTSVVLGSLLAYFLSGRGAFEFNLSPILTYITIGGVIAGVFFGVRGADRHWENDIQTVESLSWSWTPVKKYATPLFVSAVAGCCCWPTLFVSLAVTVFLGLEASQLELKSEPNQGIKLSSRSTILGGLAVALVPLVLVGVCGTLATAAVFLFEADSDFTLYLIVLVVSVSVLGLCLLFFGLPGGLWYGGLDVLQHYTLRLILYTSRSAPLNLVCFLDYAAKELNFLQKVGGGYVFMHRMLLEHFAAMEDEAKPVPQDAPLLAAATPFESVSDK